MKRLSRREELAGRSLYAYCGVDQRRLATFICNAVPFPLTLWMERGVVFLDKPL